MKSFFSFLFLCCCSLTALAQQNITLSGTLLDKADNEPLIAASVELISASKDSTFVGGAISSANGTFFIKNLSKGNYILKVSYVGYNNLSQTVKLGETPQTVDLGKLLMETNAILLAEAVVEGKKPEVIVKNDTIEFDAGSYKTQENAVVEDLLKKLPGVEVDKDGKVTVNGKEVKKFMVDGKEFFSDDPKIASKNLPAEMIEKLQVVDQKSEMSRMTGFDDGEEETIINLTIRPGMKKGTMGNAMAGLGKDVQTDDDLRYQAGAFVNHMQNTSRATVMVNANNNNNMGAGDMGANQFGGMRMRRGSGGITEAQSIMMGINSELNPKLSLNGDIRYNGQDRTSLNKTEQSTLSERQSQLDRTSTATDYLSDNFRLNMRVEWKPDSMNTLILRPYFGYNKSSSDELETLSRMDYYSLDTIVDSKTKGRTSGEGYNLGASLDFAHKFSKPGRVLSISARGSFNDSYSQENSNSVYHMYSGGVFNRDSVLNQRMENDNNSGNFRVRTSYVEPIGHNNFIQLLYSISNTNTKSINSTYNMYDYEYMNAPSSIMPMDTAVISPNNSRSTKRNSLEQRFGVSFKSVREKYNYTVGFNVDPSSSTNKTFQPTLGSLRPQFVPAGIGFDERLPNIMGDSLISNIEQNVVNFSPVVNFNYLFGERTNLRIDYEGETNQPSATQLRDFVDKSRPTNWTQGNPNLKPGYTNQLRARFQKYMPATQSFFNLGLNGSLSLNDITSVTQMLDDGVRLTTYENVNGNWNLNFMGGFNTPLKNKKFSIGNFIMAGYNHRNSYVNESENLMKNTSFNDRFNIKYSKSLFEVGVNANFGYSNISYSANPEQNQETMNWGVGGNTTWYLPYNLTIDSDINWTKRSGYAAGYNLSEVMWNASATKQLFNKKYGTGSLKLQIYDILQDRKTINAAATTNGYSTSETLSIPSYFMCSFIYKFNIFPKGSSASSDDVRGRSGWGGQGGRGPGAPGGPGMF